MSINDTFLSEQVPYYATKAYLETLLSYGNDSICHLRCSHWFSDDGDDIENYTTNQAFAIRRLLGVESKLIDFCTPLHLDMFHSERCLPPRTPFKLVLKRNPDAFVLMKPANNENEYKIEMVELKLFVHHVHAHPKITLYNENQLLKKPALFPVTRATVKKFAIPAGMLNKHIPGAYSGKLPRQVVLGLVSSTAMVGRTDKNPYKFHHFDVNRINLRHEGNTIPSVPYEPDYTNELYIRELRGLFDNIGITTDNTGIYVTRESFLRGSTLYAFDLTGDRCNGAHIHTAMSGNIDVEISFKVATPEGVDVICYGVYENTVKLFGDRHVEIE